MAYGDTGNVRIDLLDTLTSDNTKICAWTWNKLTADEKRIFKKILYATVDDHVLLTTKEYEKEWDKIQDLYSDLLDLVGYKPIGWREEEKKSKEIAVKFLIADDGTVEIIKK